MGKPKILFISHEASRSGAPLLLLDIIKYVIGLDKFEIDMIFVQGGLLVNEFKKLGVGQFLVANQKSKSEFLFNKIKNRWLNYADNRKIKKLLRIQEYDIVYLNSACSCNYFNKISLKAKKVILHLHELSGAIEKCGKEELLMALKRINKIICVSEIVSENIHKLAINHRISVHTKVINGFLLNRHKVPDCEKDNTKYPVRIGSIGSSTHMKGMDLFIESANIINQQKELQNKFIFKWIGANLEWDYTKSNLNKIKEYKLESVCNIIEKVRDLISFYNEIDILILFSREDSFPLTVIEAAAHGIPCICFNRNNGIYPIIQKKGGGKVVEFLNVNELSRAITEYLENPSMILKDGLEAKQNFAHLTPENQISKIINVISDLLNAG